MNSRSCSHCSSLKSESYGLRIVRYQVPELRFLGQVPGKQALSFIGRMTRRLAA
jgi:hypothetical protein